MNKSFKSKFLKKYLCRITFLLVVNLPFLRGERWRRWWDREWGRKDEVERESKAGWENREGREMEIERREGWNEREREEVHPVFPICLGKMLSTFCFPLFHAWVMSQYKDFLHPFSRDTLNTHPTAGDRSRVGIQKCTRKTVRPPLSRKFPVI